MQRQNGYSSIEQLLRAGKIILLGEYRGYKPDVIEFVDKKNPTGRKLTMGMINHVVEVGDGAEVDSVRVTQMVPDGTDPFEVAVNFRKGQEVVVVVAGASVERGVRKVRCEGIYDLASMQGVESARIAGVPGVDDEDVIPGVK